MKLQWEDVLCEDGSLDYAELRGGRTIAYVCGCCAPQIDGTQYFEYEHFSLDEKKRLVEILVRMGEGAP